MADIATKRGYPGLLRRVSMSLDYFESYAAEALARNIVDVEEINWRAMVEYCHEQGGEKNKRI